MNEKTCTLEKEMRQALLKKLEQNYLDYTALLQALTPEQLMDRTKEVYAAQVCYSLPSTYGWKTWAMHDVSVAAYRAGQKQYMESEDRLQKLLEHLDGKEITSAGHLSARNFTFGDEIIEMDGKLNFYMQAEFDVDAAFGTHVLTDENDDWLNIYANYDMERNTLCGTLELTLCKGDGSEEDLSYTLNAAEQEVLLRKMDAFCLEQTGTNLHDYSQQIREEQELSPPVANMRRDRRDGMFLSLTYYRRTDIIVLVMHMTIQDMLREKNITRYQLSKKSGVPWATLADICSGKTALSRCSAGTLLKLSAALDIPMEQLMSLSVDDSKTPSGKPKDRSYLEKGLPPSLEKALREYIQGKKDNVSYMDCLWGELYGAINSNQWSNAITQEQADYLREKYL